MPDLCHLTPGVTCFTEQPVFYLVGPKIKQYHPPTDHLVHSQAELGWLVWARMQTVSEKAMAPHSSTLAWKIPWTGEPGRLQSVGSLESDTTERLHFHFSLSCIGEGNGNPLQCSCLENPRDARAWWAAVYGVTQSRTRLKQLSSSSSSKLFVELSQLVSINP